MNFLPARVISENAAGALVDVAGLGEVQLAPGQISRADDGDTGPMIGFRPETMTLLGPSSDAHAAARDERDHRRGRLLRRHDLLRPAA